MQLPALLTLTSRLKTKFVSDPFLNTEGKHLSEDDILKYVINNNQQIYQSTELERERGIPNTRKHTDRCAVCM